MKILKRLVLIVCILAILGATWQFDAVFMFVEKHVSEFINQTQLKTKPVSKKEAKSYVASKLVLENGRFLKSKIDLTADEYNRFKYLQSFKAENCILENKCEDMNMHVLWRGDEFVFMQSRSVSDVDYFGFFSLDRTELLEYLKANKNLVKITDVCDESRVDKRDNFGVLGVYFRSIECGLERSFKEIKNDMWISGLRVFIKEDSKRGIEVGKFLIDSGYTCVSFGEEEKIQLVEAKDLDLNDCSFYETSADLELDHLEKVWGFSSSLEKIETVL